MLDIKKLLPQLDKYMLRRTKAEVVKDLPRKTEVVLYHGISTLQKKYYKAILMKDVGMLVGKSFTYTYCRVLVSK
jgi:SNF2 family DNA or RNA helicase